MRILERDEFNHPNSIVPVVQRKITSMFLMKKPTLNFQIDRSVAVGLGTVFLLIQTMTLAASAQLSAEETIDHIFRSDVPLPGATAQEHQNLMRVKAQVIQWLGSYQGVRQENDRSVILFERGSLPVTVQFEENGDPKNITANECPTTSVPIAQAPREYRKALSDCPNLKP
jgi:hypothetical protein